MVWALLSSFVKRLRSEKAFMRDHDKILYASSCTASASEEQRISRVDILGLSTGFPWLLAPSMGWIPLIRVLHILSRCMVPSIYVGHGHVRLALLLLRLPSWWASTLITHKHSSKQENRSWRETDRDLDNLVPYLPLWAVVQNLHRWVQTQSRKQVLWSCRLHGSHPESRWAINRLYKIGNRSYLKDLDQQARIDDLSNGLRFYFVGFVRDRGRGAILTSQKIGATAVPFVLHASSTPCCAPCRTHAPVRCRKKAFLSMIGTGGSWFGFPLRVVFF